MNEEIFHISRYEFEVPQRNIAQRPAAPRDSSRLLVVSRAEGVKESVRFRDLPRFLGEGDLLVLNDTRVFRARLHGRSARGASVEVLLVRCRAPGEWEALVKPGKKMREGARISFPHDAFSAEVKEVTDSGKRVLRFSSAEVLGYAERHGEVPLPPYIREPVADPSEYQTVYARRAGAVAAPTAGLHFTPSLREALVRRGVETVPITLHCGVATFRPVKTEDIRAHPMESEWIEVSADAAARINTAKQEKRRVIAVGTTCVRMLESCAGIDAQGRAQVVAYSGETDYYIVPGYRFKIVDGLITNFHTSRSTNLILVSAFCSPAIIRESYSYALRNNFRFYSFGDAMFLC
ncbi:MAG: tRNA preQ1(34) S-adenosylmethionine ribosyltransferase-isomerase QueA [Candidatus Omnitrophica bacterium]|nr:tRNA preQ1(34) S-adenosylmethionine ribosyltransferase-isomerase QueA [Candidatus Omnitrophota bacterium]